MIVPEEYEDDDYEYYQSYSEEKRFEKQLYENYCNFDTCHTGDPELDAERWNELMMEYQVMSDDYDYQY